MQGVSVTAELLSCVIAPSE